MNFRYRHPVLFWLIRPFRRPLRLIFRLERKLYQMYVQYTPNHIYHRLAVKNERRCFVEAELSIQPKISFVVPVYNPPHHHLLEMVYSVVNQHYENWELIIANASDRKNTVKQAQACQEIDTRIKVVNIENKSISENTNSALFAATGDYVAFIDHDDVLHPCALHTIAGILQNQGVDIIYSDEDKINEENTYYFDPFFKPKWSPDLFRNVNYINHLTVIKREHIESVGGLREVCDGAQDYDLLLRVIDETHPNIVHVPHVLYHWRAASSSTASSISNKQYIFKAGTKALNDHLKRNKVAASAKAIANRPGFYEIIYKQAESCSIVIGPVSVYNQRACADWLEELLRYIDTKYEVEIVVGNWYQIFYNEQTGITVKFVDEEKQYWSAAAEVITKQAVICFQVAALPISTKDFPRLVSVAAAGRTLAAPILVTNNEPDIYDAGYIETGDGTYRILRGYRLGDDSPIGSSEWVRNVDGLSGRVIAASREAFYTLCQTAAKNDTGLTLTTLTASSKPMVVWTHARFEFIGDLRSTDEDTYLNEQVMEVSSLILPKPDYLNEKDQRVEY